MTRLPIHCCVRFLSGSARLAVFGLLVLAGLGGAASCVSGSGARQGTIEADVPVKIDAPVRANAGVGLMNDEAPQTIEGSGPAGNNKANQTGFFNLNSNYVSAAGGGAGVLTLTLFGRFYRKRAEARDRRESEAAKAHAEAIKDLSTQFASTLIAVVREVRAIAHDIVRTEHGMNGHGHDKVGEP